MLENYDSKDYYQSLDKIRVRMNQINTRIHGNIWKGINCPPYKLVILQTLLLILAQKTNPKFPYQIEKVLKNQSMHKIFKNNLRHCTDMVSNYINIDPLKIPVKSKKLAKQYLQKQMKYQHLNNFKFNIIIQGAGVLFDWAILAMNSENYCQKQ